jgi:hypothetical protein
VLLQLGELRLGREGALEGGGLLARLLLGGGDGCGERLAAELGLLENRYGVLELDRGFSLPGKRRGNASKRSSGTPHPVLEKERGGKGWLHASQSGQLTAATAFL